LENKMTEITEPTHGHRNLRYLSRFPCPFFVIKLQIVLIKMVILSAYDKKYY